MLTWAGAFLVVTLVSAVLGFGFTTLGAAIVARVVFYIFLVAFIVALAIGLRSERQGHR